MDCHHFHHIDDIPVEKDGEKSRDIVNEIIRNRDLTFTEYVYYRIPDEWGIPVVMMWGK